MTTNETWMGSGTSVTMAYESELFLGYMPYGPTLGRTGTNKANLIKYSLGYAVDGTGVVIENAHGEGTDDVKHFTDYYHLVPDLYTGCTAKFFWTDKLGENPTLRQTALVAGNDADAIYFAGNLNDYNSLWAENDSLLDGSGTHRRGYIVLESRGSVIPAPISLEERTSGTMSTPYLGGHFELTVNDGLNGTVENLNVDDLLYTNAGKFIGKVYGFSTDGAELTSQNAHDGTTNDDTIHICSGSLATVSDDGGETNGIGTITSSVSLAGKLTAGDVFSTDASSRGSSTPLGIVITINAAGTLINYAQFGSATASAADNIYWGKRVSATVPSSTSIHTVSPKTLSDNWIGLVNTVTAPSVDIEMKQVNLALAGTRNYSYQYKGMETAGEASLDINLNHGSWLYYALGNLNSITLDNTPSTHAGTNAFQVSDSVDNTQHNVYAGITTDADDYDTTGHTSATNGKFHRVLKGTQTLCPPLLPFTAAGKIALPDVSNGLASGLVTYTFSERNDAVLPTFALELTNEKASNLGSAPRVDRNTYNETVYSQLFPGCMVNSMTLTANENEEVKGSINLNVKRAFECPDGYVSKAYDATNNDTTEFKRLFNFGQQTGKDTDVTEARHSLLEPFYFSDGTVSLFGANFMKIQTVSMTITNNVTDKRYIGQYNKQIKMAVPGQRTYELTITAQVTDRRMFDELRRQSGHRSNLTLEADGTNALIQLLFTKENGERIKLQFDDYMIGSNVWPIPDDKGPIYVDFSIMPIRVSTMDAHAGWIMQK